jgi:glycosyltransferase involved in cell wall biosynthesis
LQDVGVDISIAICTRNRCGLLAKTLHSIEALIIPEGLTHEVLVVDNGSADATRDLVQSFVQKRPELYAYHFEPRERLSHARNCAVERARGEIIAFTDDDVVVDERWIEALIGAFAKHPEVAAVQGRILLKEEIDSLPPWFTPEDLLILPLYDRGPTAGDGRTLIGANMAVRKRMFEEYGLFDIHLGSGGSGVYEDTEFGRRLQAGGERILYEPAAVVFHELHPERLTHEYVWERWRQLARSRAYVDVVLRGRKPSGLSNRRKLIRYTAKKFLGRLTGDQRQRYKYERKIHYLKQYIAETAKLRETPPNRA